MNTGKTLVITGPYEVDIKEYPVPKAADDGLVIQVEAALICGSDGHFIKVKPDAPFCDGHEFAGKIVSMGKDANRFIHCYGGDLKLGDRIAVYPHITCGKCPSCMSHGAGICGVCDDDFIYGGPSPHQNAPGVPNTNPDLYPHFKGGFGDYVYIYPETFVWKIPDDMPGEIAALMDPVAVAMRAIEMAMTESGTLQEGISTKTHALVIGAGPIGIIAAMILRHMGVEQLVITDMIDSKLEKARELARVDRAVNLSGMTDQECIQAVIQATDGGADLVLQCANHWSATLQGLKMVKKLGTYIEVGLPMSMLNTHEVTVSLPQLIFESNARICGLIANSPSTFDSAFRLLKKHREIPFGELITHRFDKLEDYLYTIRKMPEEGYLKGAYIPQK
ncbi:zinc-dependent alcohol dehydrogenase [Enterocloster citroniae]|jgi:threonine dehydrogenase-like Zn-dependent dehydrogenase|uniref:zinc-dependent alcohol dehydrogenase n=1 Tax=Enterocloster citroniae TaxID=358743 RepID=UPI00349EEF13